ncbi:MAG: DMT family transporter [Propionicimonas sp.]|uniref:DMT family transporter n=1 Tax=Propionicimonas sp. TaxID=1955623 RepID=UPI003D10E621
MLLALVLGLVAGGVIPLQTSINSRLSGRLGAILPASLVSFTVGTLALAAAVLVTGTAVPWAATAASQPWWIWVGGLCGLVFLTLNIVLLPRIGASATVVLPLVGQVFGGLLIDGTGAFGAGVHPLTWVRALGAALVVGGAVLVNLAGRPAGTQPQPGHARSHVVLWVVAVLAGSLGAIQTTVNGRLGQSMGSALAAAMVSFLVGAVGLAVICVVTRQRVRRSGEFKPWHFTGGLLGAMFVLVNAYNAPMIGTSLAVSITLLGQVVTGLLFDHGGWMGVPRRPVTPLRIVGAALVVLGVALVRFG